MIVVINAISIKDGGALVVLGQLLSELALLRPDVVWHVALCRPVPVLAEVDPARIQRWIFPWVESSPLHVKFWYWWTLPRLIRRVNADCLFSQTNYLPERSLTVPSLLLVQHAGHFSPMFRDLTERHYSGLFARLAWRAKGRWVYTSVQRASLVTVQTNTLAQALIQETGVPREKVVVIPHGQGLNGIGHPRQYPASGLWRIGYITNFGVQKNFRVLFLAIKQLVQRGHPIRLVLTLRQDIYEHERVADDLRDAGIGTVTENLGELRHDQIEPAYDSLDLFVFPSLCESFGFPMVEAMARGLPIAVADVDSNREVAGAGGAYFPPQDYEALANCLEELMCNPRAYESASIRSLARGTEFSWRMAAQGVMNCLERITHNRVVS